MFVNSDSVGDSSKLSNVTPPSGWLEGGKTECW